MNEDWREALAPTPECIDVARFGGELNAAERGHLEECVRCQTELELFREVMAEETSPASQWIAQKLAVRSGQWAGEALPAHRPLPTAHARSWRVVYAIAAALVILIGASWFLQSREPSIDIPTGTSAYRSARLELVTPAGDVAQAPNELRWKSVPDATRYRVRILEVDGTVVWSGDTTEPRAILPPAVIAQFAPGKSLRWEVQAFRGNEVVASSETQTVRVHP